jgi:hypothetical protein
MWYENLSSKYNIDDIVKDNAGNWKKFTSFHWYNAPNDADNWCIIYTRHRDSSLLEESNASAIADILEKEEFDNDVRYENHAHWTVGHIDGYAIRCINPDGTITTAFKALIKIADRLHNYPVLNEDDYSEKQYAASLENIDCEGSLLLKENAPEDWCKQVFSWLWENAQDELEDTDDQGYYPSKDSIRDALRCLGLLNPEEDI